MNKRTTKSKKKRRNSPKSYGSFAVPSLECRVRVININQGHNQELLEKCRRLWEYAELIRRIRENQEQGMEIRQAVDAAVDSCIREGILADILIRSKVEVTDMLLEEYDEKKVRKYLRREAWEEGKKEGIHTGMERKLVDQVCRKLRKGKEAVAIAEELEEEPEAVEKICQAAREFAPEYDSSLVLTKLHF